MDICHENSSVSWWEFLDDSNHLYDAKLQYSLDGEISTGKTYIAVKLPKALNSKILILQRHLWKEKYLSFGSQSNPNPVPQRQLIMQIGSLTKSNLTMHITSKTQRLRNIQVSIQASGFHSVMHLPMFCWRKWKVCLTTPNFPLLPLPCRAGKHLCIFG